jgi:hypothetical protein
MSIDRTDLDDLLTVVTDFADKSLPGSDKVELALMQSTPLPTLVVELIEAEVPHPLAWTFEVVEAVARRSASWGFVLASRYAGQFATRDIPGAPADMFAAVGQPMDGVIEVPAAPLAAGPIASLVVVDAEGWFLLSGAALTEEQPERVGLAGASLSRVTGNVAERIPDATGDTSAWTVLLGAVVCGLGSALVRQSVVYTEQREQFGSPIASFPGLRAVVGTAHAEVQRARTLLQSHALGQSSSAPTDALASAADAVVGCAVDTVQTMGGYGYIDEFPTPGMFRDAISLRARASSAVTAWRASAELAYGYQDRAK